MLDISPGVCYFDPEMKSVGKATVSQYHVFAAGKLLLRSENTDAFNNDLAALVSKHSQAFRVGPAMMAALLDISIPEAVGDTSNDSESLPSGLPAGVGGYQASAWAVRALQGEPYKAISDNTHTADAETVAQAVDVAATCLDLGEPLNGDGSEVASE